MLTHAGRGRAAAGRVRPVHRWGWRCGAARDRRARPRARRPDRVVTDGGDGIYYSVAFEACPRGTCRTGLVPTDAAHRRCVIRSEYLELQGLLGTSTRPVNVSPTPSSTARWPSGLLAIAEADRCSWTIAGQRAGRDHVVEDGAARVEWERLYRAIDDRGGTRACLRGLGAPVPVALARHATAADARPRSRRAHAPARQRADGPARARPARWLHHLADLRPDQRARGEPSGPAQQSLVERAAARAHAGDGEHSMLAHAAGGPAAHACPGSRCCGCVWPARCHCRRDVSWSVHALVPANQGRCGAHGGCRGSRHRAKPPGAASGRRGGRVRSIDAALVSRFAREVEAISRRLQATVIVVIGDDQVRHVERFEPGSPRAARLHWAASPSRAGWHGLHAAAGRADKHRRTWSCS